MAQFFKASKKSPQPQRKGIISALDHQLQGVIREAEGGTRFVAGALPGEQVTYKPVSKFSAELISLHSTSPQRRTPPCPYYHECGGCDVQHLNEDAQQSYKQTAVEGLLHKFAQIESLTWQPTLTLHPWGYRRKARLATFWDGKRQRLRLGFRAGKSKQITEISECLVLQPSLSALIEPLRHVLSQNKLGAALGHVELIQANSIHIVLRMMRDLSTLQRQQLTDFSEQHAINMWVQDEHAVTPLRPDTLAYDNSIDGDPLYFTPGDFLQINADVNQQMVHQALDWLAPDAAATVLDLFAGVGNFSLPLARRVARVVAIEGVTAMTQQLMRNADLAGCSNLIGKTRDLSQVRAKELAAFAADYWLLDPARAGAQGIAEQLLKLPEDAKPTRIVYVSCAPDTLARDAKSILAAGYQLKKLGLVDMFPQTHHIETMVCFERVA